MVGETFQLIREVENSTENLEDLRWWERNSLDHLEVRSRENIIWMISIRRSRRALRTIRRLETAKIENFWTIRRKRLGGRDSPGNPETKVSANNPEKMVKRLSGDSGYYYIFRKARKL